MYLQWDSFQNRVSAWTYVENTVAAIATTTLCSRYLELTVSINTPCGGTIAEYAPSANFTFL